jgi:serine/threonine protein kinase
MVGLGGLSQGLTPLQSQVDGLVGGFAQQATDWCSLAAMMVGGVTYRLGRIGAVTAETGRLISTGVGLGAEVTAFEMTNRSLMSLTGGGRSNPSLWRWEGQGGIRQGLLSSLITFASLKGSGRLVQGENVVVQHLLQGTGMVLGHQVSGFFGIVPRPTGSLADQFLHAEATNLQMGAGMALGHGLTQGRIHALERGLDLSVQTTDGEAWFPRSGEGSSLRHPQPALAVAGRADVRSRPGEELQGPSISLMSSGGEDGKAGGASLRGSADHVTSKDEIVLTPNEFLDPGERYKVIRHIALGGFGSVYLVRDKKFHRDVVTKIPRSENYNEQTIEAFRQEASIGFNLDPNFSTWVLDMVEIREEIAKPLLRKQKVAPGQKPTPIVVPIMQYVPGFDLHTLLHRIDRNYRNSAQKFSLDRRIELFAEICRAVHSAHKRKVVHRDLKPENIRITNDTQVRIMDWGQAKQMQSDSSPPEGESMPPPSSLEQEIPRPPQTLPGWIKGTPGYIPPETVQGSAKPDPRGDIYMLGVIGYQMFTMRHPFTIYRKGDTSKGEASLVPERDHDDLTRWDAASSYLKLARIDPPPFAKIVASPQPPHFYELEKIVRRAMAVNPEERFQTAEELREEILMAQARTDFARIDQIRYEMTNIHRTIRHEDWQPFNMGRQGNTDLWEQMHDSLEELKQMRQEWHKMADDLVAHLTARISLLSHPDEARAIIAEVSWQRLVDDWDRMPKKVREPFIKTIQENNVVTDDEVGRACAASLTGKTPLRFTALDFNTRRPLVPEQVHVNVIPLEREVNKKGRETGNYRVGKSIYRGTLAGLFDLHISEGYYEFILSSPDYAPLRLPVQVSLEDVRRWYTEEKPFMRRIEFLPKDQVPKGMVVVHGGRAWLGLDFYRHDGTPTKIYSRPEQQVEYPTFLISEKPLSVGEYYEFIDHQIREINRLIRKGDWERAWGLAVEIREYIPRTQQVINQPLPELSKEDFQWARTDPTRMHAAFGEVFKNLPLYWKIEPKTEKGVFRFVLQDPTTHRDPNDDPILFNQPITANSPDGILAYSSWCSKRDEENYQVMTADMDEIVARNGFHWTYPWGYSFSPSATVTRIAFANPAEDAFPQPIGTHPLGRRNYRDRSLFGPVEMVGNGVKIVSTEDEPGTVGRMGGGPRNPFGPFFEPSTRAFVRKNRAEESTGTTRLVIIPKRDPKK